MYRRQDVMLPWFVGWFVRLCESEQKLSKTDEYAYVASNVMIIPVQRFELTFVHV